MKVCLVTPARPGARTGNGVTARRWARILRDLGHRVEVTQEYAGGTGDVLVALHARRSAGSIERFHERREAAPIVLALTGTDVYGDLATDAEAQRSLALADRYIVLQPLAVDQLPPAFRSRCHVVFQSATAPPGRFTPRPGVFDVAVLAHLRPVKDPLRAAAASRLLPATSTVRVLHAGGTITPAAAHEAQAESAVNPRYRWLGDLPRWKAMRLLARSHLLALTSRTEGGANVVSEALACRVPVVSSRIPGSVGMLGPDYPGYYEVGDTEGLASLLYEAERPGGSYAALQDACRRLAGLVEPAREREAWSQLLRSL